MAGHGNASTPHLQPTTQGRPRRHRLHRPCSIFVVRTLVASARCSVRGLSAAGRVHFQRTRRNPTRRYWGTAASSPLTTLDVPAAATSIVRQRSLCVQ